MMGKPGWAKGVVVATTALVIATTSSATARVGAEAPSPIVVAVTQPPVDPSDLEPGLFLYTPDTWTRTRLTTGDARTPLWSPAHDQVAYTQAGEVWVVAADGAPNTRLTTNEVTDSVAGWSRSGTRIVGERADYSQAGSVDIMVAEADGSGSQTITGAQSEDRCPSWSPVAARIVYHRVGKGNIHSIRPSGEDDKRLTSGPALDYAPVWSPDGQKILFRRTPAGSSTQEAELFVMDRVGSDVHRLTDNQLVESQYAWSPDGKKIAYKTDGGGSPTLWVMRADGEFERAVAETSFGPARLTWAPGSRKIYFSRYDAVYYQDNDSNIWSARANGSDAHAVTSYPESEIFPSWGSTASTC